MAFTLYGYMTVCSWIVAAIFHSRTARHGIAAVHAKRDPPMVEHAYVRIYVHNLARGDCAVSGFNGGNI